MDQLRLHSKKESSIVTTTEGSVLRLLVCTFNVGNCAILAEEIQHWLPNPGEYDIIAIGLQESRYKVKKGETSTPPGNSHHAANSDQSVEFNVARTSDDISMSVPSQASEVNSSRQVSDRSPSRVGITIPPYSTPPDGFYQNGNGEILPGGMVTPSQIDSPSDDEDEDDGVWRSKTPRRDRFRNPGATHLRKSITGYIGDEFDKVISCKRYQMRLKVFAKIKLITDKELNIEDCESAAENTGIGYVGPNKGGLVCKLKVKGTTLCFISCHLTAHEGVEPLARRIASCEEIFSGARLPSNKRVDVANLFHHIFFLGDLNFRLDFTDLNVPREDQLDHVLKLIDTQNWDALAKADELNTALQGKLLLAGFETGGPLCFKPTFKLERGEGVYSAKRIPSYTDRILWKSMCGHNDRLKLVFMNSVPLVTTSDHVPVHASFTIELTENVTLQLQTSTSEKTKGVSMLTHTPKIANLHITHMSVRDLVVSSGAKDLRIDVESDPAGLIQTRGKPWSLDENVGCTVMMEGYTQDQLPSFHVRLIVLTNKDEVVGVANMCLGDILHVNSFKSPSVFNSGRRASLGSMFHSNNTHPNAGEMFSIRHRAESVKHMPSPPLSSHKSSKGYEFTVELHKNGLVTGMLEGTATCDSGRKVSSGSFHFARAKSKSLSRKTLFSRRKGKVEGKTCSIM